jgi:hypothetical protein
MSRGWFARFLSRNNIAIRIATNKAQQAPEECYEIVTKFLCFNRRNSQLRDGLEETLLQTVLAVGCFLLSNIVNTDQLPLPWEYLEGRTYGFKGAKTVWIAGKKSGWDKRQATIQLTVFADGISRVKPLIIFRGAASSSTAPRQKEEKQYDSRVVVKFNPKGYANEDTHLYWLEQMLAPVLGAESRLTLPVMDLFKSHKTPAVLKWLKDHNITPSVVPAGCTSLVQPLDVSINRPFKDILKQSVDDENDRLEELEAVHQHDDPGPQHQQKRNLLGEFPRCVICTVSTVSTVSTVEERGQHFVRYSLAEPRRRLAGFF